MTTDELRIFNSDLPSLDKSISPMSTPMEEKPFIAIKAIFTFRIAFLIN